MTELAQRPLSQGTTMTKIPKQEEKEIPGKLEFYEGKLRVVVDARKTGYWRFHEYYDRDGYCDNPGRGY
ncbi:hypothetical protein G6K93_07430 [Agrobacterium rhizogenes]|nr:hypothetical protein [Rhizobium rhizogenes]